MTVMRVFLFLILVFSAHSAQASQFSDHCKSALRSVIVTATCLLGTGCRSALPNWDPNIVNEQPTQAQSNAIKDAVQTIREGLGEDHPVTQKLQELIDGNDLWIAIGEVWWDGQSHYSSGWDFGLFDWIEIHSTLIYYINTDNSRFKYNEYWKMVTILIHEGFHVSAYVDDPEAGRLTAQVLRQFLPNRFGNSEQPLPIYLTMSEEELVTVRYLILKCIEEQIKYSLQFPPPGQSHSNIGGLYQINNEYREFQEDGDLAGWNIRRRELSSYWGIEIPEQGDGLFERLSPSEPQYQGYTLEGLLSHIPVQVASSQH